MTYGISRCPRQCPRRRSSMTRPSKTRSPWRVAGSPPCLARLSGHVTAEPLHLGHCDAGPIRNDGLHMLADHSLFPAFSLGEWSGRTGGRLWIRPDCRWGHPSRHAPSTQLLVKDGLRATTGRALAERGNPRPPRVGGQQLERDRTGSPLRRRTRLACDIQRCLTPPRNV